MPDQRYSAIAGHPDRDPAPQARRGPVGARLHRAAEQERAVQEGRRPAPRPRPDPAHLLQARLRLDRPGRPARPLPLDGPLHPARPGLRRRQDRDARGGGARRRVLHDAGPLRRRAALATRPCARSARSASTSPATPPTSPTARTSSTTGSGSRTCPRSGSASTTPACPALEACGDSPRPFLGSPVAGVAADEIIDGTSALEEIQRRCARQPGVLEPAAQVQDRRSPGTPATTSRPRPTTCRSSAPSTPSTAPASTSGSAAACRPTRCWPRRSASGSRSTRSPTSGRAWPRSSATTATAGCARGRG